jgi:hypothetical protein
MTQGMYTPLTGLILMIQKHLIALQITPTQANHSLDQNQMMMK